MVYVVCVVYMACVCVMCVCVMCMCKIREGNMVCMVCGMYAMYMHLCMCVD